jgi:hypothetical protein
MKNFSQTDSRHWECEYRRIEKRIESLDPQTDLHELIDAKHDLANALELIRLYEINED